MEQNQYDKIVSVDISDEMKKSYIDYAMSVIVARALPDVRDGLKPVQRRILFSMNELNLEPSKSYKKSARIVGEVMGKYHPHGDSSIYQAMVRLAQNFSMRYVLVDGHGNFGSIDGDGAAASRYTEARMSKISVDMLLDIDKNTVDFIPNYDENEKEPVVLPARIPNLLINGSSGIAVGMATNIPPHNIVEVIDAIVLILKNKIEENRETDIDEIIKYIKGPDFPTGGNILGKSDIQSIYRTGRGKILIRSQLEIEKLENGRERIVITEIPYQVNKARLVEKIADLVHNKRIDGITGILDESSGDDIKITIDIKKDVNANIVLNQLYKFSQLQESFSVIMLALVDGKPEILNIKQILDEYLKHQIDVVKRRVSFDLEKAERRAHILEGLKVAILNIDDIVKIIRESYDNAKEKIINKFFLSDIQAQSILDMQLKRLQGLENEKIDIEHNELASKIENFKLILSNEKILLSTIKDEMINIKSKYADTRRTRIINNPGEIDIEDLIEEETIVVTMTNLNYIKRIPITTYKSQNRGGRGIMGMQTREEDFIKSLFITSTHDYLLFFTNYGKVFKIKGYEVPEASRTARGMAIVNLLGISNGESITTVMPLKNFEDNKYIVMVTKKGIIKKVDMMNFSNIRKDGIIAINLKNNDELISAFLTDNNKDIFIGTRNGIGIRFNESSIRCVGRNASGVIGIRLNENDYVVSAQIIEDNMKILNVTENGYGKCTNSDKFKIQSRGKKGLKIHQLTDKTGYLTDIVLVNDNEEVMLITSEGVIIRLRAKEIPTFSKISQGVKLMNLNEGVKVVSVAKIPEDDINYIDDIE